jgi:hypothetical protein
VGEILVESGTISAFTLARALTEQHGVELQSAAKKEPVPEAPQAVWRPLGKLLVEEGFLTKDQLQQALVRQQESHGRRKLGEILVAEGFLSGSTSRSRSRTESCWIRAKRSTVVRPVVTEQFVYRVSRDHLQAALQGARGAHEAPAPRLWGSPLSIEDANPDGLGIQRTMGGLEKQSDVQRQPRRCGCLCAARPHADVRLRPHPVGCRAREVLQVSRTRPG